MRLSVGFAVLGLVALAGCASPPKTAAPGQAVNADSQETVAAAAKPKFCQTGSRLCSKDQQSDPAVLGMSGTALGDAQRGHPIGYSAPP